MPEGQTPVRKNLMAEKLEPLRLHPRTHPSTRVYMNNVPGADTGRHGLVREADEVTVRVLYSRLFQFVIVIKYRRIDDAPHGIGFWLRVYDSAR
jgi:hypothetical protein